MPVNAKSSTTVLPAIGTARLDMTGRVYEDRPLLTVDPEVKKWILARRAILDKWAEQGGPASSVGLPLDPQFSLVSIPGGSQVNFRGGSMKVMDRNPGVVNIESRRVVVTFEGYGLEIRQESGDELYGTLDCKVGSTGYKQSFDLLQVELGPEDSNRIYQSSIVLWDGPPADINIVASLAENDEGNREEVRQRMRQRIGQIFQAGAGLVGASVVPGAESIAAQSSLAAESASNDSLVTWALNGISDLIGEVLGLGDDAYNPAALTITANEMMQVPPLQTYRCWSDARTIPFTHSRTVTCRDDGGDVGQITVLFRVRAIS